MRRLLAPAAAVVDLVVWGVLHNACTSAGGEHRAGRVAAVVPSCLGRAPPGAAEARRRVRLGHCVQHTLVGTPAWGRAAGTSKRRRWGWQWPKPAGRWDAPLATLNVTVVRVAAAGWCAARARDPCSAPPRARPRPLRRLGEGAAVSPWATTPAGYRGCCQPATAAATSADYGVSCRLHERGGEGRHLAWTTVRRCGRRRHRATPAMAAATAAAAAATAGTGGGWWPLRLPLPQASWPCAVRVP